MLTVPEPPKIIFLFLFQYLFARDKWLIDFNAMATHLGLSYAYRLISFYIYIFCGVVFSGIFFYFFFFWHTVIGCEVFQLYGFKYVSRILKSYK